MRRAQRTKADQAFEAMRWLLLPNRPGVTGQLACLVGRTAGGQVARLWRRGAGAYELVIDPERRMETGDADWALGLIWGRAFQPRRVVLRRDFVADLFRAAVLGAEQSTKELASARSHMEGAEGEEAAGWAFMNWFGDMKRTTAPALQAVVFSVATVEAQVNVWAEEWFGGWSEEDEKQQPVEKCKVLAARLGVELSLGQTPGQWFGQAADFRNAVVHAKPSLFEAPLVGPESERPGESDSLRARRACRGARGVLVHLAKARGEKPPRYLAACPPGDPADEEAWLRAWIMTGSRDDPDFPRGGAETSADSAPG